MLSDGEEGSLSNENADVDESEETITTEDSGTTDQEDSEEESNTEDKTSDSTLINQEKTEKGTKLAKDPLSQANQLLANERAKIRQYEDLLNNPTLLKNYVKQFDPNDAQSQTGKTQEKELRVEDVQTTEDLHKFLAQQDAKVQAKVKELDTEINSVKSNQQGTAIANRISSDIAAVRETYPELNPKSDVYSKELDSAIGQLYEKFDLDPKTKSFKGQASIREIADVVMSAAGIAKKQGSTDAQTIIRDKRSGRTMSGAANAATDESKLTAGQIIAQRIQQARKGR